MEVIMSISTEALSWDTSSHSLPFLPFLPGIMACVHLVSLVMNSRPKDGGAQLSQLILSVSQTQILMDTLPLDESDMLITSWQGRGLGSKVTM